MFYLDISHCILGVETDDYGVRKNDNKIRIFKGAQEVPIGFYDHTHSQNLSANWLFNSTATAAVSSIMQL